MIHFSNFFRLQLLNKVEKDSFSIADTNICKGIAILFMILHHAIGKFYDQFDLSWYASNSTSTISLIVLFLSTSGKVCVSIFTILSGYGLTKSMIKYKDGIQVNLRFVLSRLVKFYSIYLPVFLASFVIRIHSIEAFSYFYGSTDGLNTYCAFIADALGLSALFKTPSLIDSWFITAILIFYCIFPLLYRIERKIGGTIIPAAASILLILAIFGVGKENVFYCYLTEFVTGIWLADKYILDNVRRISKHGAILSFGILTVCFVLRLLFSLYMDYFFALSVIFFEILVISKYKNISSLLSALGKHSANMWLLHVRFLLIYLKGNEYIRFLLCVPLSFEISKIFEKAKEVSKYNQCLKKLQVKILPDSLLKERKTF